MTDESSTDVVRVLHVDDTPEFADVVSTYLERENDEFVVETATDADEGLEMFVVDEFDCVVSDYDMPGRDGIALLESIRAVDPDLPFILFTGKGSEEVASDAISAGVTDYLQKERGTDQYTVLANRIGNAVDHYRSQRLVERSERRLREIVDALPQFLYVVDEDGTYLLANEALADFHGTSVSEIEGSNVTDVLDDDAVDQFMADLEDVLESGTPKHVPIVEIPDSTGEVRRLEPRLLPYDLAETDESAVLGLTVDVTEHEERSRDLERTYERMRLALEHTDSVVFEIDFDTGAVVRHGTYERSFGVSPDETPTWEDHLERAVHPEDRGAFRRFHERLIDGDRHRDEIVYRTNPENRGVRWMRATVYVRQASSGSPRRALGISRDVTEQRRHERELERANVLLSTLFDTLPVGVLAEDASRKVLAVNQQLFDLFEMPGSSDEVVGADCGRLARAVSDQFADPEEFVRRIDELIAEREPVRDEELVRRDGRTFARSHQPIDLSDGAGHLWVYHDVTERTERERRLEAMHEATQELMAAETREEVAEVGVEATRRILGLDANSIHLHDEESGLVPVAVSDTIHDLIDEVPTFTDGGSIAWRVYEEGEPLAIDDVLDDPDVYNPETSIRSELLLPIGEHGLLLAGAPTPKAFDQRDVVLGGILVGNVAAALEQVKRTAQVRARERELTRQNDRLKEFTSIVSHDLRSPLNVAEGRLSLAMDECESDHLPQAAQALDRMGALIDDLLALAREGDRGREAATVDLASLARSSWRHVATADATLVTETERTVRGDESRLQQLFENLFRNSVEHGGDDVTVTVGDTATGFYVADDGPGIPSDTREAVLDAGYSTVPNGTGFGLSIVEQVVDAHGWAIAVTDSADGGTRVEISDVDDEP